MSQQSQILDPNLGPCIPSPCSGMSSAASVTAFSLRNNLPTALVWSGATGLPACVLVGIDTAATNDEACSGVSPSPSTSPVPTQQPTAQPVFSPPPQKASPAPNAAACKNPFSFCRPAQGSLRFAVAPTMVPGEVGASHREWKITVQRSAAACTSKTKSGGPATSCTRGAYALLLAVREECKSVSQSGGVYTGRCPKLQCPKPHAR